MVVIEIHDSACRGCRLCVDVCPTSVLEFDERRAKALVREAGDCVGCLSCGFLCPSSAVRHTGVRAVKNFYRDMEFSRRMERYL